MFFPPCGCKKLELIQSNGWKQHPGLPELPRRCRDGWTPSFFEGRVVSVGGMGLRHRAMAPMGCKRRRSLSDPANSYLAKYYANYFRPQKNPFGFFRMGWLGDACFTRGRLRRLFSEKFLINRNFKNELTRSCRFAGRGDAISAQGWKSITAGWGCLSIKSSNIKFNIILYKKFVESRCVPLYSFMKPLRTNLKTN